MGAEGAYSQGHQSLVNGPARRFQLIVNFTQETEPSETIEKEQSKENQRPILKLCVAFLMTPIVI